MTAGELKFRHEVIDPDPPGSEHDITLIADVNGSGRNDIIIGGKIGPPNLFWYENPSWARHEMAAAPGLEAGGVAVDLTGTGRPDVVAGQQYNGNELYWFENPEPPTGPWPRRVIEDRFVKYHDQAVGDVDNDGRPELVFLAQCSGVLAYYDLGHDPRTQPWPREQFHLIDDTLPTEGARQIEGLRIADLDGDGRLELIAGPHVYRVDAAGRAERLRTYVTGYTQTRVAVGDLTGDGTLDIVLAEGESNPGRLVICRPPQYRPRVLADDLFYPHSLELADFNGNGRLDIFVAEMGLGGYEGSRLIIFLNGGGGRFEPVVIHRGVPTHEAKVGDLTGHGRPDIVGKPYDPQRHIDVWFNET
jgi:hypothetical protein